MSDPEITGKKRRRGTVRASITKMISRVADIDRKIPLSNSRAYKHPQEKWQVVSAALKVLQKLLQTHEVIPHDFVKRDFQIPVMKEGEQLSGCRGN